MQPPRNYKDLIQQKEDKLLDSTSQVLRYGRIVAWLFRIPVIRSLCKRNIALVHIVLSYYQQHGLLGEILELVLEVFGMLYYKKQPDIWWRLMRYTVSLLQHQQITYFFRDFAMEDQLIIAAGNGPRDYIGYDVSYSLVGFSLWMFERGNVYAAINLVQQAIKADTTWAYPEYLFGWYGLFVHGVDSTTHFVNAVHIDWSFLQRIKKDRMCQKFPDIVKKVQQSVIIN